MTGAASERETDMMMTRREAIATGTAAAALAAAGLPARATADAANEAVLAFTGGAAPGEGGVTLTTPEIAENGGTVPVEVAAEGATSILVLASGNPSPGVATFHFGPLGAAMASTRIRLARTQEVISVAKMADGSFRQASNTVKVTIGGCGG